MPAPVVWCRPEWVRFVGADWLDRIRTVEVSDRFHAKQGRSIGRWTLTTEGATLVVYLKRHFVLPKRDGLLASVFPKGAWSPGLQEWENLKWAEAAGLRVPRTWAVAEFRGPGLKLQSILAVEELAGMLALHEAVPMAFRTLDPKDFAAWKRGLIAEMARLTRELHRRQAYHKDLYLCHFYIAEADTQVVPTDWRGRVVMIDFHRMARHRLFRLWHVTKDLAQLLYSSDEAGITGRDRVRFWKLYRSGDWGDVPAPPEWLRAGIRWKWQQYRRHNEKRK